MGPGSRLAYVNLYLGLDKKKASFKIRCKRVRNRADNLVLVKFGFRALSVPRFFGV